MKDSSNEYRQSIVAFLDLLGFSNTVKDTENEKQLIGALRIIKAWNSTDGANYKFAGLKKAICESGADLDENKVSEEINISYFSDSLVITLPYEEKEFDAKLKIVIYLTANLLSALAMNSFFVRGGIAIGNMYHKKNIFFGPAFLEAHDLESKKAVNPRVIFSNKIMEEIGSPEKLTNVKKADDGLWHIDWFSWLKDHRTKQTEGLMTMGISPFIPPIDDVSYRPYFIKSVIEDRLHNKELEQRVKSKYEWLLNQMNEVFH